MAAIRVSARTTPGSLLTHKLSEDASPGALDRVADAFVLDDAKRPRPHGPVLREPKTRRARAVSKRGPHSTRCRPGRPRGDGNEARRLERLSQRLALERVRGVGRPVNVVGRIAETVVPAGRPRDKHAAAAAVGAPAGFVTAARATR